MIDWKSKLAAWLHDPAEKSLILMRTPEGHEQGTARILRERLGIDASEFDKRADWLASAADRPNWPRPEHARYPAWEQVRFTDEPCLIHPLSGDRLDLQPLSSDIGPAAAKALSIDHFAGLVFEEDPYRTFLAFWRFGPEAGRWGTDLGALWQMLPADSRVPDHSIWSHLDTVCALSTALADGDRPALLAMSLGPVQGFIAQARSTSDLWAGSHLLSTIVWEAIRSLVEAIGPDAVLFPSLRGVPAVDAWLAGDEALGERGRQGFAEIGAEFLGDRSDTNPLFAAALPNKLVAIVPASRVRELAERAILAARQRAYEIAERAAREVFVKGRGLSSDEPLPAIAVAQIREQLAEFPEVFWASAVWPLGDDARDLDAAAKQIQGALGAIDGDLNRQGLFQDNIWRVLSRELKLDGFEFWRPNAGVLYPAVFELAERSLAAAKATRPFEPLRQKGHRCTQCGEREWLTHDRDQLMLNRKDRQGVSVWGSVAGKRRSWAREGEHLCAVCAAKRLWPTLFAREVGQFLGGEEGARISRFVVSTQALAISTAIEQALDSARTSTASAVALGNLNTVLEAFDLEPAALPKGLMKPLRKAPELLRLAKRLPALLEQMRDEADPDERISGTDIRVRDVNGWLKDLFGARPETYYALIQMDGDRMGAWLAGNEDEYKLAYRETWHPKVRAKVDEFARRDPALAAYTQTKRPPSPARHAAISRALNDFSIHLARHVVEDCVKGKLIYAGGDDVLALVAVDDLLDAMQLLRLAYSGLNVPQSLDLSRRVAWLDAEGQRRGEGRLWLNRGFGLLDGRLMTLMGHKATASMGVVVAHHTAPLGMVLRQLRAAENRAKADGRDRFCIRVLKRGGGEVSVTSPWWPVSSDDDRRPAMERRREDSGQTPYDFTALGLMKRLRDELALTPFSRGAIYRAQQWFEGLTDDREDAGDPRWREQIAGSLAYQFARSDGPPQVARDLVDFVCEVIQPEHPRTTLENLLATAEFLARGSRVGRPAPQGDRK